MNPSIAPHLPLALSMGDPAGIGIEISLKAWLDRAANRIAPFALIGDADIVAARSAALGLHVAVARIETLADAPTRFATHLPVFHVPCAAPVVPGKPDSRNGHATIQAIDLAVAAVVRGEAAAVVTNPIAKHVLHEAGFRHPGHTEYLAHLASQHYSGQSYAPVMMLAADDPTLRVVPMTIHEPLVKVPSMITAALIMETTRITHRALREQFGIAQPRVAIAGLNPHAGENGSIGTEDRDIIAPAIAALRAEGIAVSGPHSADTLFHPPARATYDAVICMYHDQALIPIKTLAFDTGVNLTLGLPFVRTSPDHGTAFDIAGHGTASATSLIAALNMAARLGSRMQKV
jgi:4-hydroxythreonine-4-phosphate dehydrogenase